MEKKFTRELMIWHKKSNSREMPWKGEKDPYKIWLSEIILQQTRVAQGMAYYEAFTRIFPTIQHLAGAKDETVFKLWEGLGYYNRCKNLLFTARQVVKDHKGIFPNTYENLLALKGVGPYTAAAIASFAYNLPYAVVDGNVFRVLSRYFGLHTAIDSPEGKVLYGQLANTLLEKKEAGLYNQAIMDFGAVVCKPFSPGCHHCPLQKSCMAYQEGLVDQLPIKVKSIQRKHRWLYYFLFEIDNTILVHLRTGSDIWQNLFEPYLVESPTSIHWDEKLVKKWLQDVPGIQKADICYISPVSVQQLTHQQIKGQFIRIQMPVIPFFLARYRKQPISDIRNIPFPRFITQHFESDLFKR